MGLAHIGAVERRGRIDQIDQHRRRHARHVDLAIGEQRLGIPVFLENRAVLHGGPVADVLPRVVAVEDHLHTLVVRRKRIDDRQPVGVEGRSDRLALQPHLERRDRIRRGLFGIDRNCRLRRSACGLGLRIRCGHAQQPLQRIDGGSLPRRQIAKRIGHGGLSEFEFDLVVFGGAGSGFAGRRAGRQCGRAYQCRGFHSRYVAFSRRPFTERRRAAIGRQGSRKGDRPTPATPCAAASQRHPAPDRTPRRSGGRSARAEPRRPECPIGAPSRKPGGRPTSDGSSARPYRSKSS